MYKRPTVNASILMFVKNISGEHSKHTQEAKACVKSSAVRSKCAIIKALVPLTNLQ